METSKSKVDKTATTKEIKCLSCRKTVTVELQSFGRGSVASCPKCNKLAYNSPC